MKIKLLSCLAFSSILFSGLAIINPELGVASRTTNTKISTIRASENRLISEIANLEVEIILLKSRYTDSSLEVTTAREKQLNLRKQLSRHQPNSKKILNKAISQALKAKIAELEVERAKKRVAYIEHSPEVQVLNEDIKSLKQRLTQIQSRNSRTVQ
jgi:chromosome segregation ATPase